MMPIGAITVDMTASYIALRGREAPVEAHAVRRNARPDAMAE
jgi:hypothetical protein